MKLSAGKVKNSTKPKKIDPRIENSINYGRQTVSTKSKEK